MKIGIVDLDTSHPQNWIPIERELGHEVIGVWDGGAVHPTEYVEKFAAEKGLSRIYGSLAEMAADVDCAIIHGCDWDTHIQKARPFIEAGKSALIDKPMAGNVGDLRQLVRWAEKGARIAGSSSLRFCVEVQEWLARPVEERGTPHTAFCGCAVDEFNYGIHAYSMLSGIMGPGIERVRHLSQGPQRRIQVTWKDGRTGFLVIGSTAAYLPFYITIITEKGLSHLVADNSKLYRALLEATLPYLSGKTDTPPVPIQDLIEPELCAIAARASWLNGDAEVALADLKPDDKGYDGAEFAVGYRKMRYPNG
jgi:hypothetical protein